MSLSQFRGRGRAYQCKRCAKIDRKGRMISHVLKHHVPFDRVPYSCSLCSFRCTDKQSLVDHIKKYSRHREEEAKCGTPDYTKVLRMAANPYEIGEDDMAQLSREDSLKWHGRHSSWQSENPLDDSEGLFEDEEEEAVLSGGLALPKWLVTGFGTTPSQLPAQAQSNDAFCRSQSTPLVASKLTRERLGATKVQAVPTGAMTNRPAETPFVFSTLQPLLSAVTQQNQLLTGAAALCRGLSTTNPGDVSGVHQDMVDNLSHVLDTPQLRRRTPSQTPLLDGQSDSILPQLQIQESDLSDPLYKEAIGQEPERKRQRTEGIQATKNDTAATKAIVSAIKDAAKMIADAIDANTRAVRNNEKALDRVTVELSRIERKAHLIERAFTQKENQSPDANKTKDKRPPLKSVVTKPKEK